MDKKEYLLVVESKELETQLNLENNYREEAYEHFIDYRNAVNKCVELGYISEKKYKRKYQKRMEFWEEIFEGKKPEEEEAAEEDEELLSGD